MADGVDCAGKGRLDTAVNEGRGTTSKAQALIFRWSPHPHQFAHALQPLHLVGTFKAPVIGSSLNPPSPGNRLEQAVSDHPVRVGPRFSWATKQRDEELADQALLLQGTCAIVVHDSTVVEEDHESSRHCSLPLSLLLIIDDQRVHEEH